MNKPGIISTEGVMFRLQVRGLLAMAEEVALAHHVTVEEVASRARSKRVCAARRVVFARLRSLGLSLPEIGRILGRDHTTVLVGLRKAAA